MEGLVIINNTPSSWKNAIAREVGEVEHILEFWFQESFGVHKFWPTLVDAKRVTVNSKSKQIIGVIIGFVCLTWGLLQVA